MGPIALFDKSFLQSLSIDESVWFDHFFLANVCPLFYVETLADLDKSLGEGRSQEKEVARIAEKTPVMGGAPCAHHFQMCIGNLMGHPIPMTGQIPVAGGRLVKAAGKSGVVFDESPEAEAFSRWQKGEFHNVERQFAREWREGMRSLDLNAVAESFRALGVDGKNCKSLSEAKQFADELVKSREKRLARMKFALGFLNIQRKFHLPILEKWKANGYLPLSNYAPYAAHVLTVEIFFQVALAAHLISSDRPSNRIDVGYLFYLPFCMVFISQDRLHQRCATLFLRSDQDFLWGPEVKAELKRLNEHFSALPEATKEKGLMSFSHYPPGEDSSLLVCLWDRHLPRWRQTSKRERVTKPADNSKLVEEIRKMAEAPALTPEQVDFDPQKTDSLTIQRLIHKRRGSWWQLPKDLKETEKH